jgi:type I restriction enzyme M protein
VWFYDLRTNKHFTLKTRTLKLDDLQDFIACYHPDNRHERVASERFKFSATRNSWRATRPAWISSG